MTWRTRTERSQALVRSIAAVVGADGKLMPREIRFLERFAERVAARPEDLPSLIEQGDPSRDALADLGSEADRLAFLDVLIDAALVDGRLPLSERRVLQDIAARLALGAVVVKERIRAGRARYASDRDRSTTTFLPPRRERLTRVFRKGDEPVLLFTDIKGSVALFESLGDEKARDLELAHERILCECLDASGGHLVKEIGDSVFGTFTRVSPAVEAALRMQEALYRWRLDSHVTEAPTVRIVLHRGPAVVEDADVLGSSVNVAARLLGYCDADEVLVSMAIHSATDPRLASRFASFGPILPKGSRNVIEVFRWQAPWKTVRVPPGTLCDRAPLPECFWKEDRAGEVYLLRGGSLSNQGTTIEVGAELKTLGRGDTVRHRVETRGISREHMALVVRGRQCWVFDIGGAGGVLLRYPRANRVWQVVDRAPVVIGSTILSGALSWVVAK